MICEDYIGTEQLVVIDLKLGAGDEERENFNKILGLFLKNFQAGVSRFLVGNGSKIGDNRVELDKSQGMVIAQNVVRLGESIQKIIDENIDKTLQLWIYFCTQNPLEMSPHSNKSI